jgi:hypothetical protein
VQTISGSYSSAEYEGNPVMLLSRESAAKYDDYSMNTPAFLYNQSAYRNANATNSTGSELALYPAEKDEEAVSSSRFRGCIRRNFIDLMMYNDGFNEISDQDRSNYTKDKISDCSASEVLFLGVLWNSMDREQTVFSVKMNKVNFELRTTPSGFINILDTWHQRQTDTINNRLLSTVVKLNDDSNMGLKLDLTLKQLNMNDQKVIDSEWDASLKAGFKF